jgi:hypothetical protein
MLRVHILPAFGEHRLDAITRTEVKAFAEPSPTGGHRSPCAASSPSSAWSSARPPTSTCGNILFGTVRSPTLEKDWRTPRNLR